VITACLGLINSTSSQYDGGAVAIDSEKEFYRLQGDLYSLCRVKASFNNPDIPYLSAIICLWVLHLPFFLSAIEELQSQIRIIRLLIFVL
jgi:hypothetical protein